MNGDASATGLIRRYGFIEVQGRDATVFLQSQLSADIAALDDEQTVLTGWHDPKGRVLACLRVVRKESSFWMALPRAMLTGVLERLSLYVLRAEVRLTDVSDRLLAAAVLTGGSAGARFEVYAPREELAARVARHHEQGTRKLDEPEWELADIRAGIPEVYPGTSGAFTGQMLNLDLIGAISFSKGCYPGQEIIARTHHLGRAKRRMQRYVSSARPLQPGESLVDGGGRRAGQVVRSAASPDGSELLVVTALDNPPKLTAADGATMHPDTLPYSLNRVPDARK